MQGANLAKADLRGTANEHRCPSGKYFTENIRESVGQESNLSGAILFGGLSQEDMISAVESLSYTQANILRMKLKPHLGKETSNELPENSNIITGAYTIEEAEKWIAEYEEAMSQVPSSPEDN